ncbi:MAG TPA: M23 family metallopeptidase [Vicinamibacterales bacterium]|nr:M23 family metallopeptidase [Vicinamibacterales bacterium]
MRRLALVCLLVFAAACRGAGTPAFLTRGTPHEQYARSLEQAGLADTALARDWLAAAARALAEPKNARLPLTNEVTHEPARPSAYGYRLELPRGRVLRVKLTITGDEPALVFIDLFEARPGDEPPRRLASAAKGSTTLEHEIERDGTYVLRIQPELLRGGTLRIGQRTTAALTFPVRGRTSAAVGSFFGDPRDNNRREHHGIDIFAPRHTPVVAAAGGIVTSVGTSNLGGNVVWVWDPRRGQSHYYAHLEKQAVTPGTRVEAGDVIGYVGNSGNARGTAPHLHFGIYSRGEGPIDPLPFVN